MEEASRLLLEHKIGALPVVKDGRLVGIVTESDLYRMVIRLLGVTRPSTQLELELIEPARELAVVMGIAHEHGLTDPGRLVGVFPIGHRATVR